MVRRAEVHRSGWATPGLVSDVYDFSVMALLSEAAGTLRQAGPGAQGAGDRAGQPLAWPAAAQLSCWSLPSEGESAWGSPRSKKAASWQGLHCPSFPGQTVGLSTHWSSPPARASEPSFQLCRTAHTVPPPPWSLAPSPLSLPGTRLLPPESQGWCFGRI